VDTKILAQNLRREISLYKELVAVLQGETRAVVERDYRGLYDVVVHKESILGSLEQAGRARNELTDRLCKELGLSRGETPLASIIEEIPCSVDQRDELRGLCDTLKALRDSAFEINKVNCQAVRTSLENINKTLGLLGNLLIKDTYEPTGRVGSLELKGSRLSEGV